MLAYLFCAPCAGPDNPIVWLGPADSVLTLPAACVLAYAQLTVCWPVLKVQCWHFLQCALACAAPTVCWHVLHSVC
jgi:hypothetical protein